MDVTSSRYTAGNDVPGKERQDQQRQMNRVRANPPAFTGDFMARFSLSVRPSPS